MPKSVSAPAVPPAGDDDEDTRQQVALIKALLVTVQHFFGGFQRLFGSVSDPRQPAYITYPLSAVLGTGAVLFLLRRGARRQGTLLVRGGGPGAGRGDRAVGRQVSGVVRGRERAAR